MQGRIEGLWYRGGGGGGSDKIFVRLTSCYVVWQ